MPRSVLLAILGLALAVPAAHAEGRGRAAASPSARTAALAGGESSSLEAALRLYRQNRLGEARVLFERAVKERPQDPEAHAWLAETLRRLGDPEAAVREARVSLDLQPDNNSFAHQVLGAAFNPMYSSWKGANADSSWRHVVQATRCDPGDGNAWLEVVVGAMLRRQPTLEKKALQSLVDTGFLTPAILAYQRWVLRPLPPDAVLLTNGDLDTYPAWALQEVEQLRRDVAVVNLSLLNAPAYARLVRDRFHLPMMADAALDSLAPTKDRGGRTLWPSTRIVADWVAGQRAGGFTRPIVVAATVSPDGLPAGMSGHLRLAGGFWLCTPESASAPEDTTMLRRSLADVKAADVAGPASSPADRSPVRSLGARQILGCIPEASLRYGAALLKAGRKAEAAEAAKWAEQFQAEVETGVDLKKRIEELKKQAGA